MYLIGFLRHVTPMVLCLVGLYLFTVRRENCEKKYILCMLVTLAYEYVIYYFIVAGDPQIQGIPLTKLLTMQMITLVIFWGGLYVHGGWSRIGFYIFASDMFLAIGERLYWSAWEHFTHRTMNPALIYFKGNAAAGLDNIHVLLPDCLFGIPFVVGAYKLRNRPLRPEWLFKALVAIYLIFGSSPLIGRPGYERVSGGMSFLIIFVWIFMFFLVVVTLNVTAARENRRILYLRKQVVEEQSRLLMIQKEKVRRLRHDVKKHLANLEYILEKDPGLRSDPALLRYQEKLNANEKWMEGVFYCDSTVMNLCFEQIKRYCDDKGIEIDISLKRLSFSGWTQEDQLTFGTLVFDLLQIYGDSRSVASVSYAGDCVMRQNILRIRMNVGEVMEKRTAVEHHRSILEKDIKLILLKYGGRIEHEENVGNLGYVINWEDAENSM